MSSPLIHKLYGLGLVLLAAASGAALLYAMLRLAAWIYGVMGR